MHFVSEPFLNFVLWKMNFFNILIVFSIFYKNYIIFFKNNLLIIFLRVSAKMIIFLITIDKNSINNKYP